MRPINSPIGSGIEVIDTFHHVLGRPFADIAACVQNNQAHFVVWRSCETNLYVCMKSYADLRVTAGALMPMIVLRSAALL